MKEITIILGVSAFIASCYGLKWAYDAWIEDYWKHTYWDSSVWNGNALNENDFEEINK